MTFLPKTLQSIADLGFSVFSGGRDFDLNIIGIRSASRLAGSFDDEIQVWYQKSDQWHCRAWPVTCDPGVPWLENGLAKGTAILVEGQHRGCWTFGKHRGQYDALVQCKPMPVYRDANKDQILDLDSPIETGIWGINAHKAGRNSNTVGRYSAGCQVFKRSADFTEFLALCQQQKRANGWDTFTYTLVRSEDL